MRAGATVGGRGSGLSAGIFGLVTAVMTAGASAQGCEHGCWPSVPGVPGVDGQVRALAATPDGGVIVAGEFDVAGDQVAGGIARFDRATGEWSSLSTGLDGAVNAVLVTPSGNVVAAGEFQTAGGVPAARVAIFDIASGEWSGLGTGVDGNAYAVALLPTGELIVGGYFMTAGAVSAANIAQYDFATGAWSALGSGTNDPAYAMLVLPSGELLVGGVFTIAGGEKCGGLARWIPGAATWAGIAPGVGGTGIVSTFCLLPDGDVIVGGFFSSPGANVARYSPATDMVTALNGGIIGGPGVGEVFSLAHLSGRLIVGGHFAFVGNTIPSTDLAEYDLETSVWSAIGASTAYSSERGVRALLPVSETDVVVGANIFYAYASGPAVSEIAILDVPDREWSALSIGTNRPINAFTELPDGRVVVGGTFSTLSGGPARGIGVYNPATANWTTLGPPGTSGACDVLITLSNGDVLAGGARLNRYHAATDTWSNIDTGDTPVSISSLAELHPPNGDIIVAGSFQSIAGLNTQSIVRYNLETNVWTPLAGMLGGSVADLQVIPNDDLMVSGYFHLTGTVMASNIARYRPSTDQWFAFGNVAATNAGPMTLHGNNLIAVGAFRLPGQFQSFAFARYDTIAGTWSPFAPGEANGSINDIGTLSNGDIVIVGRFTAVDGTPAGNIARYSPSAGGVWSALAGSMNDAVRAAIVVNDDVIFGGEFTIVDGAVSAYFGRVDLQKPTCPTDFNTDGVINSQDFFDFLAAFFETSPAADFNHDDAVNSQDLFDFLAALFAGC